MVDYQDIRRLCEKHVKMESEGIMAPVSDFRRYAPSIIDLLDKHERLKRDFDYAINGLSDRVTALELRNDEQGQVRSAQVLAEYGCRGRFGDPDSVRNERDRLLEALERAEFGSWGRGEFEPDRCPDCGAAYGTNHQATCGIGLALSRPECIENGGA